MRTQTRDTSEYGFWYVSGLLRLEAKRTIANIGHKLKVSSQNLHHFMSNSPWSGPGLIRGVQAQVGQEAEFEEEAMLIIDESANEKKGDQSAGAGRQHNGRLGKLEMSQVGVFLSLVTPRVNTWVDGELFLPEACFSPEGAERRAKAEVPAELTFQTKPQLAWQMIKRAQHNGLPFTAVAMDTLYGRSGRLRLDLERAGLEYYADVPSNSRIQKMST